MIDLKVILTKGITPPTTSQLSLLLFITIEKFTELGSIIDSGLSSGSFIQLNDTFVLFRGDFRVLSLKSEECNPQ